MPKFLFHLPTLNVARRFKMVNEAFICMAMPSPEVLLSHQGEWSVPFTTYSCRQQDFLAWTKWSHICRNSMGIQQFMQSAIQYNKIVLIYWVQKVILNETWGLMTPGSIWGQVLGSNVTKGPWTHRMRNNWCWASQHLYPEVQKFSKFASNPNQSFVTEPEPR